MDMKQNPFKAMIHADNERYGKKKSLTPEERVMKSRFKPGLSVGFTALTKDLAKKYRLDKRYTITHVKFKYGQGVLCRIEGQYIKSSLLKIATPIEKKRSLWN